MSSFPQIMLSRFFTMPSAPATMNVTCVPTLGFPWCISLTATGPPLSSCKLLKADFHCVLTTSQPWASHLRKWQRRSVNTYPTWGSRTILIPSGRLLVRTVWVNDLLKEPEIMFLFYCTNDAIKLKTYTCILKFQKYKTNKGIGHKTLDNNPLMQWS